MKKIVFAVSMVLAGAAQIRAQSIGPAALNGAGGGGTIAGNRYDWSVGEMTMVSTFTGASVIVTQGLLQPYRLGSAGVQEQSLLSNLLVYPNPASSVVNIRYTSAGTGSLYYCLLDMNGKQIMVGEVDSKSGSTTEQLDISDLSCASYMLEITLKNDNDQAVKTSFKIQKIK